MDVPEQVKSIYERILRPAKQVVESTDQHEPMFFLDPDSPDGVVIGASALMRDEVGKLETIATVRHYVDTLRPEVVVFVSEGWCYHLQPNEDISMVDQLRARYGSVQKMPGAIEMLSISIETHAGIWIWNHNIIRDGGHRSLSDGELADQNYTRFAFFRENQLPPAGRAN